MPVFRFPILVLESIVLASRTKRTVRTTASRTGRTARRGTRTRATLGTTMLSCLVTVYLPDVTVCVLHPFPESRLYDLRAYFYNVKSIMILKSSLDII